jgi:hypothetical protein
MVDDVDFSVGYVMSVFHMFRLYEPNHKIPPKTPKCLKPGFTPQTLVSHILGPKPPKIPLVHLALLYSRELYKEQENEENHHP